jgi:hypothetical protein
MTLAEIKRVMESKNRTKKAEAQEKAAFDYILAGLIGLNVSRCFNKDNGEDKYPKLEEVYASLFEDKAQQTSQEKEAKKNELWALRFKQFANFHNKNFKKGSEQEVK